MTVSNVLDFFNGGTRRRTIYWIKELKNFMSKPIKVEYQKNGWPIGSTKRFPSIPIRKIVHRNPWASMLFHKSASDFSFTWLFIFPHFFSIFLLLRLFRSLSRSLFYYYFIYFSFFFSCSLQSPSHDFFFDLLFFSLYFYAFFLSYSLLGFSHFVIPVNISRALVYTSHASPLSSTCFSTRLGWSFKGFTKLHYALRNNSCRLSLTKYYFLYYCPSAISGWI